MKIDDIGLALAQRPPRGSRALGRGLVAGDAPLLAALAVVGTAAMLWVGGHILLLGVDELGWHAPYDLVHSAAEAVGEALAALGGLVAWLVETLASAAVGLAVGAVVVLVVTLVSRARGTTGPAS